MPDTERFAYLFASYYEKTSNEEERKEFFDIVRSGEYDQQLEQLVAQYWDMPVPTWVRENEEEKAEAMFQVILNRVKVKRISIIRKWAVAASVLLLLGLGYRWLQSEKRPDKAIAKQEEVKDVPPPVINRAMVTLANGKTVFLDSVQNGQLATEQGMQLVKLANGQVVYQGTTDQNSQELSFNTLSNPRGSQVINITLADGSKIWLDAGSSITYPVAFIGRERKVTVNGQAYFEVAHDAGKPFYVSKGDITVKVLGTHFNVNAYDDEESMKITLLEGSVQVNKGNQQQLIKPGEQVIVNAENLSMNKGIDVDEVMAWKNGKFDFNHASIQAVMRQLARWYDLQIEYKGTPGNDLFAGDMQRDLPLSKVLDFLKSSQVHFEVEGKKVTVLP